MTFMPDPSLTQEQEQVVTLVVRQTRTNLEPVPTQAVATLLRKEPGQVLQELQARRLLHKTRGGDWCPTVQSQLLVPECAPAIERLVTSVISRCRARLESGDKEWQLNVVELADEILRLEGRVAPRLSSILPLAFHGLDPFIVVRSETSQGFAETATFNADLFRIGTLEELLAAQSEHDAEALRLVAPPGAASVASANNEREGHMDRRYEVFISSTYEDLKEERDAVMRAVLKADCFPAGMELFPAANNTSWTVIQRAIQRCDYYVLILAGRYGSIDEEKNISFTEREYDYALAQGIPVLAFLHGDPDSIRAGHTEKTDAGRQRLEAFRLKVNSGHQRATWRTRDELAQKVREALDYAFKYDSPRPGWIRGPLLEGATLARESARADSSAIAPPPVQMSSQALPPRFGSARLVQEMRSREQVAKGLSLDVLDDALRLGHYAERGVAGVWPSSTLSPQFRGDRLVAEHRRASGSVERIIEFTLSGVLAVSHYLAIPISARTVTLEVARFIRFARSVNPGIAGPTPFELSWSLLDIAGAQCIAEDGWSIPNVDAHYTLPAGVTEHVTPALVFDQNQTLENTVRLMRTAVRNILYPFEGRDASRPEIARIAPPIGDILKILREDGFRL